MYVHLGLIRPQKVVEALEHTEVQIQEAIILVDHPALLNPLVEAVIEAADPLLDLHQVRVEAQVVVQAEAPEDQAEAADDKP